MHKLLAFCALAMAGGLLGLQIIGGLEYTVGEGLYTQASMVAALVTLAALPIFIEAARYAGLTGVAVALFVAFLAFLAYSLPATTGRTGEVKEVKAAHAAQAGAVRDDLERTRKTLDWARDDWVSECGGGEGPKCRGKRNTVQALEDRVAKLQAEIEAQGPITGDLGSDLWGWALGASPEVVRKVSVLSFAIGTDVIIWALIWLTTALFRPVKKAVNDNRPSVADTMQTSFPEPLPPVTALEPKQDGKVVWARQFRKVHGRSPSIPEVQAAFPGTPKTSAWRAAKAA